MATNDPIPTAAGAGIAQSTSPVKRGRGIWRKLRIGFVIFVGLCLIADWAWKMSGSNQWELVKEENGVKSYTFKAPGDRTIKVKAIMQGDYTLTQLAAMHIVDDNLQTCKDWFPECTDFTRLKEFDMVKGYDQDMWRLDFPFPFKDRELLLTTMVSQDPKTKIVVLDVLAMPATLPNNPDAVRIERMHNRWQFTPLANGKVEVELIQDTEMGGMFPYFLLNMVSVDENYKFFSGDLRKFLLKDKYVNAKLPFIQEVR
jgi:hypothetical protein